MPANDIEDDTSLAIQDESTEPEIPVEEPAEASPSDEAIEDPIPEEPARGTAKAKVPRRGAHESGAHRMAAKGSREHQGNPNVYYLNGDALSRPLEMPKSMRGIIAIFVVIAIVIGGFAIAFCFDKIVNEPVREQERLQESLARDIALDLPPLLHYIMLDDAGIDATIQETYRNVLVLSTPEEDGNLEVVKLPLDVSVDDAAVLYARGIENLSALQTVRLLNGSWDLRIDRLTSLVMSLHYADFKSESLAAALNVAMEAEGLSQDLIEEQGDDDGFGNAFASGHVETEIGIFSWRISACPLSAVYSVSGMPSNATYVGVKISGA